MDDRGRILIVEDDPDTRSMLHLLLRGEGFETCAVPDGAAAVALLRQRYFEVVIVDLAMPGLSGIETIRRMKGLSCDSEIIILTGNPSLDTAISAVREQVYEYLLKSMDIARLKSVVESAVRKVRQNNKFGRPEGKAITVDIPRRDSETLTADYPFPDNTASSFLIGSSPAISRIRDLIAEVGPTNLTVLIRGETGAGKEVVARCIHASSEFHLQRPFAKVNCPAISDELFESEMFGHEKGAFTGAITQRVGRFELGAEGTIFLDEIGAISLGAQAKLLQAIEHKRFMRVGGRREIAINVRILAATSAVLETMIEKEQFRPDLLYRLQQFSITIPPLRDHREDIPELATHFMRKYSKQFRKDIPALPSDLMARLCAYDWPGNVRQLNAVVAQYCLTGDLGVFERELPSSLPAGAPHCPLNLLQKSEISAVKAALEQTHGNQRQAALVLGLSYSALRRRISKYKLSCDKSL